MSEVQRRGRDEMSIWDRSTAERYAKAKHGPDGAKFLDPHLYAALGRDALEGMDFLDLGAGAGPWSQHALEQGARTVTAVELNPAMVEQAKKRISAGGDLPDNVSLVKGDVARLIFGDIQFDRLASINVGCNLPKETFKNHFREAERVARSGARFVVTAPDSLRVPFTTGQDAIDIQAEVDRRWALESEHIPQAAKRIIDSFQYILRATFVLDESGKPVLITEENIAKVNPGDPIVRRIPGLVVDNNWHTAEEYIESAEAAGWYVDAAHRDSFASEQVRVEHNAIVGSEGALGPEYVGNPSFLVMNLVKK